MGSNLNSTNSDLIKSGPGPHPRVLVYKKEVRKPPLDLLATNGGYMFSLCPFLPRVLYSKEQKELKCFLPTQFLHLSLSSHYHLPPPILHEWIGHIVADSKKHTEPHEIRGMKKEIPSEVNREVA